MGGGADDFVLDYHYADWVWNLIQSSSWFRFPGEDTSLNYRVKAGLDMDNYERDGNWDNQNPDDWVKQGRLPATLTPKLDFMKDKVRKVSLSGDPYSVVGTWYSFKLVEELGEPAQASPLRVTVTQGQRRDVIDWAESWSGEFLREKGVIQSDAYAEGQYLDDTLSIQGELVDLHVKIPDITTEGEAKAIFEESLEWSEKGVRQAIENVM